MALLSPTEYKNKKGQSAAKLVAPSTSKKSKSGGLMSPSEYKASIAPAPAPTPVPASVPVNLPALNINGNGGVGAASYGPVPINPIPSGQSQAQPAPAKKGILNSSFVKGLEHGLETSFNYGIAKPASMLTTTVADVGGALNNLFAKPQVGYDGEKILPSQKRNLLQDLKAIATQPGGGGDIAHQAMVGSVPNDFTKDLPGTGVSLGDIEENLLQGMSPIPGVGVVKKGVAVAKDINASRNLSKAAKDFIQRTKDVTSADAAATASNAARSGLVQDMGGNGEIEAKAKQVADNFNNREAFQAEYEKAIDDQHAYLKQSMQERSGVNQGGLIKDEQGEVIGRYGRTSNNPPWLQEFNKQNGRNPTAAELKALAKEQVDNGFQTEMGKAPAFQPSDIQEIDQHLQEIQGALPHVDDSTRKTLEDTAGMLFQERSRLQKLLPDNLRTPAPSLTSPDEYKKSLAVKEPVDLAELVKSKGFNEVTPETIAQTYNGKTWYHGSGNPDLKADKLDPNYGNHESLFGQGIYLTDNPKIAEGYANSRGKRTKTPTIHEMNVNVNKVLDLESPITPDVKRVLSKSAPPLDYLYNSQMGEPNHFSDFLSHEMSKPDATPEKVITALRNEIGDFSYDAQIPTSEFVEDFQELAQNFKEAGYDALTHTGGLRTGKDPHRVMIMLDPRNWHGETAGAGNQVIRMEKYKIPEAVKPSEDLNGKALNEDVAPEPQPIKLTPAEVARNKRIEEFSKEEDNPIIPDTSKQIQTKTSRDRIPLAQRANEAYIKGVDNLHRVNQFDQAVADTIGKDVHPSNSAYKLALNSRGSDMITRQIIENNLVDSRGNVVGDSLKSVADLVPKGKLNEFEDYLIAKHSVTRMGRGEKVYKDEMKMTIQKAKAIAKGYEDSYPQFKVAAQAYYDYNRELGQAWLVDTGLLSQSQWDGYREANPYYVPNNRIFSDLEKRQQYGSRRSFGNQTNPVQKAPGSQRPIVSPFESTIENTAKYVSTAKKNEVAQVLYKNMLRKPDELSAWGEIVDGEEKDVSKLLDEGGVENVLDEVEKSYNQKPDLTKGNIVSVLIDGQRKYMRIDDPQLLEALTNISPQGQDYVTRVVGKATNAMKTLTTGINPVFGLVRNIARDVPHAYIASKSTVNPVRFGVDLVDAVTSVLADSVAHSKAAPQFMQGWLKTRAKLYNAYKNVGGGHASPTAADRNLLAQSKESILPSNGVKQRIKRPFSKALHALENLNNAVEAAPRLGEFKRLSKSGSYDSKVNALYESNDLTTNFKKYGNVTKNADAYIPYLNAAVQGLDQLYRMGTRGGAKRLTQVYAKAIGTLTLPTVVLYLINHDDPNYQQLSNYTKDTYMLIPKGDGKFIKIAKPRELGDVFSTSVERSLRAFADDDPQAFQSFGHDFLQNFLPPGASGIAQGIEEGGAVGALTGVLGDTVLGPIASLASNKDFANRPIVPGDLADVSPPLQYDSKTSAVAKYLGAKLNASPKQLDYLLRSYGGVIGQLGIPATAPGSTVADTLNQQVIADPTYSNDIGTNFYNAKAKADRAKSDQDQTHKPQPAAAYQPYYDKMARAVAQIRAQSKAVQNDNRLTSLERVAQLLALQHQMNELEKKATIATP